MSQAITVQFPDEVAAWIEGTANRLGIPAEQVVREHLERACSNAVALDEDRSFMRLAGSVQGAPDLSTRRGFTQT